MTHQIIIGIDPGKQGAIALLDANTGNIVDIYDMPDMYGAPLGTLIANNIADHQPWTVTAAYIERVGPMPKQGVKSVWTFAANYGGIQAALGALHIPCHTVETKAWKTTQNCHVPSSVPAGPERKKEAKRISRERAINMWPTHADMFVRVKDDGRADACHIARHGIEVTR